MKGRATWQEKLNSSINNGSDNGFICTNDGD